MSLPWHPRAQRTPRWTEEAVVQFGELGEPTFIDEAEVLPEEVERHFADAVRAAEADAALEEAVDDAFGIERADRLPLPPRSGPRLDPQTTARVGRRLQHERLEADEGDRATCARTTPP